MKKDFFDYMFKVMKNNKDVYLIFVGLGYPRMDEFIKAYPNRAINTEASEQTALDIAVGLAYSGKTPFVYTITPFLLRGFETIRTFINYESLHIVLVGAGRNDDYSKDDGYTHDAKDIGKILDTQENIEQFYPDNSEDMINLIDHMIEINSPCFLSITR